MKRKIRNPRRAFFALLEGFAFLSPALVEQDFQKDVGVHQAVHRSPLR
jgi:hypothetical protein